MAWSALTSASAKFTPAETNMLQVVQGSQTGLQAVLTIIIAEWVSIIKAASPDRAYPAAGSNLVPDQFRRHILASAVWTWLRDFPKLAAFKTKEREDAAKEAADILSRVANRTYGAIESPAGTDATTGNWNSNPKIIGRMAPLPQPQDQVNLSPVPFYANPNATTDQVPGSSPGQAQTPLNLEAQAGNGFVEVTWNPSLNATTYSVYRSTTSGQEALLASGLAVENYQDNAVVNGTQYFYQVAAVNSQGRSPLSSEVSATPMATIPA